MLSSFSRNLSNQSILSSFRDSVQAAAKEFVMDGMQDFFTRWGENMYQEGMQIKDEKELNTFVANAKSEIEAIKRQATIESMYKEYPIKNL